LDWFLCWLWCGFECVQKQSEMENGQAAAVDGAELTPEQVKQMRDVLKQELAKLQGARDVNTVIVKAAAPSDPPPSTAKVSASAKGFSKPPPE